MIDSKRRSLVKALLWQALGLASMILVGLYFTGSIKTGGTMALVNAGLGLVVYLIYERFWQSVGWGRLPLVRSVGMPGQGRRDGDAKGGV